MDVIVTGFGPGPSPTYIYNVENAQWRVPAVTPPQSVRNKIKQCITGGINNNAQCFSISPLHYLPYLVGQGRLFCQCIVIQV